MDLASPQMAEMVRNERFPKSAAYDTRWMLENQMGPNAVWLTEWLCEAMALKPGMRVLDMGCGKAMSSIFLAREFGVRVWANDLWVDAADNWRRVCEAGMEDLICPIHAEAHALPYAEGFFDAIVSIDSYHYYGTCDLYLRYMTSFLRPGGQLGMVVPALMQPFEENRVPSYLSGETPGSVRFWDPAECFSIRTLDWWRRHWEQTRLVDVQCADTLADGWRHWLQWVEALDAVGLGFPEEPPALRADEGRYLGLARLVATRAERTP